MLVPHMQRAQFFLGDLPNDLSGDRQDLDTDILRHFAAGYWEYKAVEVVKGFR